MTMISNKRYRVLILTVLLVLAGGIVYAQMDPGVPPPAAEPPMPPPAAAPLTGPTPPSDTTIGKRTTAPLTAPAGEQQLPEVGGTVPQTPPPGLAGKIPTQTEGVVGNQEMVYLNVQDSDIKDVIKQISKFTGKNFIIDDKIKGKVTIISERPMTREEAYQTFLSALEVAGYTTVKGPANVIKVVALKDAMKSPIPTHVDTTPYTDAFVTRLIPLENISALEMSNAIKELVSKDGNLFAYPATNTLIITDSGSNIDRIMKIVKELDQEGPQQVMEIIPVKNTIASDIAKMVQDLFLSEKGGAAGAAGKGTAKKGAQPEELEEVSKIVPDERTNSVIVVASKRAIENIRAIIARLDSRIPPESEGRIHVYYLKHAKAKDLAETLSSLTAAAGAGAGAAGAKGADIAVARFDGGVKITADQATNSLVITALPKDFNTLIEKVVSKLDIPRRQVYFEAIIMEMSLTKGLDYGVQGFGGAAAGGGMIGIGQTLGGPSLMGSLLSSGNWPGLLGGVMSSRTTNITVLGANGTSQTVEVPAFSSFLTATASRGETNVVATPNLLTLDNEEATMTVLSKEPTPGSTTFGAQGIATAQSVDYKEAGLELKIKPQITEGNMVRLEIEQKLSGFTQPKYSTNLNAPAMKERKVKTVVVTEDGQTVVLAGLMDDQNTRTKRKVPLLGDIPLLGFLFSTTSNSMSKNNLLIFITPHVINDRSDFAAIVKRKIEERNRFIDQNFSKSKQRQIRDTIKTHREDLLEFSGDIPPPEAIGTTPGLSSKAGTMLKSGKAAPAATSGAATKYQQYPQPSSKTTVMPVMPSTGTSTGSAPVLTVPESGLSSRGTEIPITTPPPAAWKPIVPPAEYPKALPKTATPKVEPTPVMETTPPVSEKKVKGAGSKVQGKTEAAPEEAMKTTTPQWLPTAPKEYKKPVVPTPAFEESAPSAKQPVITTPETKTEEQKLWKKPAPQTRNGETELAY